MGRDNSLYVHSTREQIYSLSMREQITHFLYVSQVYQSKEFVTRTVSSLSIRRTMRNGRKSEKERVYNDGHALIALAYEVRQCVVADRFCVQQKSPETYQGPLIHSRYIHSVIAIFRAAKPLRCEMTSHRRGVFFLLCSLCYIFVQRRCSVCLSNCTWVL